MKQGVPGGAVVQTYQTTATVTGIDAANRKVTLVKPDGEQGYREVRSGGHQL